MLRLSGHIGTVHALAFDARGQALVSGGKDGSVRLWDVATGREDARLEGHTSPVLSIAFHHERRVIASGSADGTLKLWDVATRSVNGYQKQMAGVTGLAWSNQTDSLLIGCGERLRPERAGEIRLWNTESNRPPRSMSLEERGGWSLSVARHGSTIAWSGGARSVEVRDFRLQKPKTFRQPTSSLVVALSDDGNVLVSAQDRAIKVWDVSSGRERATIQSHRGLVRALAVSPCGRHLASASQDGTVRILGLGEREIRTGPIYEWPVGPAHSLAFAPNGLTAAVAGENGDIWLWDLED